MHPMGMPVMLCLARCCELMLWVAPIARGIVSLFPFVSAQLYLVRANELGYRVSV